MVDAGVDAVVLTSSKVVYENAGIVTGVTNAKKIPDDVQKEAAEKF